MKITLRTTDKSYSDKSYFGVMYTGLGSYYLLIITDLKKWSIENAHTNSKKYTHFSCINFFKGIIFVFILYLQE